MNTINNLAIVVVSEGKNILPYLLMALAPAVAGAAYLSKKERKRVLRKARWQLLKTFFSRKLKLGKGIRIFIVLALLVTTILGVTIWPLWVGMVSFFAFIFFLLATVNIQS